jgi:RNA polymerase sigma factor (TIGR02999 family)
MPNKEGSRPLDPKDSVPEHVEFDRIVERIYENLRRVAARLHQNGPAATRPTSLLHDAYLSLRTGTGSSSHLNSVAVFTTVMRRILVDKAREHHAAKRGGGELLSLTTEDAAESKPIPVLDIIDLDRALDELEKVNSRQARVVECRFLLGCSSAETAKLMSLSVATVERDWAEAKAFLSQRMNPGV